MKSGPIFVQRFCEAGVSTYDSYLIFIFYLFFFLSLWNQLSIAFPASSELVGDKEKSYGRFDLVERWANHT